MNFWYSKFFRCTCVYSFTVNYSTYSFNNVDHLPGKPFPHQRRSLDTGNSFYYVNHPALSPCESAVFRNYNVLEYVR